MSSYDHHSPSISVDDHAGVRLVTLHGEHDLSTAAAIASACAGPPVPTVIDLSAVAFIDSAVISTLLAAHAANASRGFAVAANPDSHIARILSLVLADTVMPVVNDTAQALDLVTVSASMNTPA